ncbi:AMP-binding enzyme family protein [Mycobacterium xenopi 4042]|uniref:AMP-binding enzyme family protein n=1 Tax=Mycobacterium xenopi 4042 TaxID=1299334 RepID=X7ZXF9_MYCXE|nr:AMP-binding enzyme family protein [Mycobacterium xenopi 4042]
MRSSSAPTGCRSPIAACSDWSTTWPHSWRAGAAARRPGGAARPSSAEFVVGLLAGSRVGLVVVPLDPALPVAEQHARIAAAGARVVLTDAGEREHAPFPCWSIALCHGGVSLHTTAAPFPPSPPPGGLRPDDAMIMFTGGTTGSPKMVPWTHDNIAGSLRGIIATYGLGPQDATVAVMPLFHGHGLMAALLSTLVSGERCCCRPAGGFLRTRSGTTCEPPGHLVHRGADHPPYPVGTQWD